ncbi:MAG: chemotaxis protein CheA [Bacteroidetes bacterium]|jgi:two-component system chemotaxis sensor kinase CheA|nr:chemotaxis protein CheA [Bacteroidota bacterium]
MATPHFTDDMQPLVENFIVETRELLDDIEQGLLQLETNAGDTTLVDALFRSVHSLKGTAGFLSLEQLSVLAHRVETVLKPLREGAMAIAPDTWPEQLDVLFDAFDQMKVLAAQVEDQQVVALPLDPLLEDLEAVADGSYAEATAARAVGSFPITTAPSAAGSSTPPASADPAEATADTPAAAPTDAADAGPGSTSATPPDQRPTPLEARPASPADATNGPQYAKGEVIEEHGIYADDMTELVESFIVETRELFDGVEEGLLRLETHADDGALVDEIFRAVHTVKGTAGFLSLEQLSDLTHHFEDVLNRLRRGELDINPDTWPNAVDVLFAAFDQMKTLVHQVGDRRLVTLPIAPLVDQLKAISEGSFAGGVDAAALVVKEGAPGGHDTEAEAASDTDRTGGSSTPTRRANETIRVEVDRLDSLMDLVGELVLSRNRLLQLTSEARGQADNEELTSQLIDNSAQIDFITSELQNAVMHTRMVQMGRVFSKFPRLVRDLAKEFEKEIDLVIEGEETELDKSLTEEIGDPLIHLVRNAADHGIEQPAEREAAGKPRTGTIRLSAEHEGNHIVIRIVDDGAGINPEKLRAKAVEKGVISKREAEELSETETYELIFHPGFSTAATVSQVSGRGVGMDVVKTNLTKLNGTVAIDSELGSGTTFTLKLPLTLAIIQGLQVRVGQENFAIPLHTVGEVVRLTPETVETINGREVTRIRDDVLPLIHVGEELNVTGCAPATDDAYAVVVRLAHQQVGLVVNGLISQGEVVIKPLNGYLKNIPGIAGSTILGDGRVIMILDVAEFISRCSDRARGMPTPA